MVTARQPSFMTNARKIYLLSFIFAILLGTTPLVFSAEVKTKTEDMRKIALEVSPAVVQVNVYKKLPQYIIKYTIENQNITKERLLTGTVDVLFSRGTAFFVTEDGYLITNKHVVSYTDADFTVTIDGVEQNAEVVYKDDDYDLAVLKINGGDYRAVDIAESDNVEIGDEIITIGNALGREKSISSGEIKNTDEYIFVESKGDLEKITGLIESNARLYPGDSGGPLLNSKGEVVGVNMAITIGERSSFSIPVHALRQVLSEANVKT